MKKVIAVILVVCMVAGVVACESRHCDKEYVGNWVCVAAGNTGKVLSSSELADYSMELKKDGTAIIKTAGKQHKAKWSNDNSSLKLKVDKYIMTGLICGDAVKIPNMLDTGYDITFAKEGTDAANPIEFMSPYDKFMIGTWKSYEVRDADGKDCNKKIGGRSLQMTFGADHTAQAAYKDENSGEQKWTMNEMSGSFDNPDAGYSWHIEGAEIAVTHKINGVKYIFKCTK